MCNKKREKNINCKASIMITNTVKNKEQFYLIKDIKEIKTKKQIINTSSNIITDILNDTTNINFEENIIISFIISYIFENILKRDKLKNLETFLLQSIIRFIIAYIFHHHVFNEIITTLHLPL
tara:strand:- start:147 stop:515 length:369 start_codon:yes stop_codon:yes gene_type:complete